MHDSFVGYLQYFRVICDNECDAASDPIYI